MLYAVKILQYNEISEISNNEKELRDMMNTAKKGNRVTDMREGNPVRLITAFAVPLLIGNVFQQIYSVVDTMVAGYCLGDRAIAAIGSTHAVYSLILQLSWGLASGFVLVITRNFGAGDRGALRKTIASTFSLSAIITVVMTTLSLSVLRPFLRVMNTPDSILEDAHSYMVVIVAGLAATMLYNMFAGIMRAFGNSVTPLYALIFSSLLNVGLDLLFVAVFHMGVGGAALATVIAQGASGVICGWYVLKNYRAFMPRKEDFLPDWPLIREMLSTGGAMAFMYSIVSIGSLFYQGAVNGLGDTIITAHTASEKVIGILMGPMSCLMDATSTFVGQNWGAGKADRVREAFKKSMIMEIVLGLACCGLVYLLGEQFIRLLTGTTDTEVLRWAVLNMRIVLPFFPVLGVLFILRTSMQAMGQKIAPVISSTLELAMRFVGALWMVPAFGYYGVSWNTPLTWSVMTAFLFAAYLVQTRKRLKKADLKSENRVLAAQEI